MKKGKLIKAIEKCERERVNLRKLILQSDSISDKKSARIHVRRLLKSISSVEKASKLVELA